MNYETVKNFLMNAGFQFDSKNASKCMYRNITFQIDLKGQRTCLTPVISDYCFGSSFANANTITISRNTDLNNKKLNEKIDTLIEKLQPVLLREQQILYIRENVNLPKEFNFSFSLTGGYGGGGIIGYDVHINGFHVDTTFKIDMLVDNFNDAQKKLKNAYDEYHKLETQRLALLEQVLQLAKKIDAGEIQLPNCPILK